MQDIFYGFLVILMIIFYIIIISTDSIENDESKLKAYSGYIITDKEEFPLFNCTTLRKDSLSYSFFSEDIIFDNLNIGDTIK